MTPDTWKDYQDASDLVRDARVEISNGPRPVWDFLHRVGEYLDAQRDRAFNSTWQELRKAS